MENTKEATIGTSKATAGTSKDVKVKKTTKKEPKTPRKEPKKSTTTSKKRVKTEKPNYLHNWELGSYLENIERIINIWNNVSINQHIPIEIKDFIYKQLNDAFNGKLIDPFEPTTYEYVDD